ncbi:hypothetical protein MA16_Dca002893 [Dendrobium catenatum]|uniref:Uncharacterized protein n=1 Tax=Dendrobium catenatum TaxID=906689 RepID=A0A2I0X923_9ASPA|nr:hypothetical protein MA16_Dca002893 [Dendrobium catenatum]
MQLMIWKSYSVRSPDGVQRRIRAHHVTFLLCTGVVYWMTLHALIHLWMIR